MAVKSSPLQYISSAKLAIGKQDRVMTVVSENKLEFATSFPFLNKSPGCRWRGRHDTTDEAKTDCRSALEVANCFETQTSFTLHIAVRLERQVNACAERGLPRL